MSDQQNNNQTGGPQAARLDGNGNRQYDGESTDRLRGIRHDLAVTIGFGLPGAPSTAVASVQLHAIDAELNLRAKQDERTQIPRAQPGDEVLREAWRGADI